MSRDSRISEDPGKHFSATGSTRKCEIRPLFSVIIASDRRLRRLNRKTTAALHTAVQGFIYKVDLAYQPDGRLAVDAYAD